MADVYVGDFTTCEAVYEQEVELDEQSDKRHLLLSEDALERLMSLDSRSQAIRYAYCYGLYRREIPDDKGPLSAVEISNS